MLKDWFLEVAQLLSYTVDSKCDHQRIYIKGLDGMCLLARVNTYQVPRGKAAFAGFLPNGKVTRFINVSYHRPASAAARDIRRRLLIPYEKAFYQALDNEHKRAEMQAEVQQWTKCLMMRWPTREHLRFPRGVSVSFEVKNSNDAELKLLYHENGDAALMFSGDMASAFNILTHLEKMNTIEAKNTL